MSAEKIYIVIPAYNEAVFIRATLEAVLAIGRYQIIVVDDGSTDDTFALASSLVPTLRHATNRGMGAALVTGTEYALRNGALYIVHFDADGQHHPEEIERLLGPLFLNRADIVIGSRYLQKHEVPWTKKHLIHKPALVLQNLITGLRLTDVHNGFRAMNRHAATRIVIRQDRMAHASEIIHEVKRNHLRFTEVPVTISYHEYGQGMREGLRVYFDLLTKRFFK